MLERNSDKILLLGIIGLLAFSTMRDGGRDRIDHLVSYEESEENLLTKENDGQIMVHIVGEVVKPDVYWLDEGARLVDLVELAGGFTAKAREEGINLAMKLEDEMLVSIPSIDDFSEGDLKPENLGIIDVHTSEKININTAGLSELQELSGIGPKTAEKIISYREKNKFSSPEDIMNVNGIGEKTYEEIKDFIRVR